MSSLTLEFDGGVAGMLAGLLLPFGHLLNYLGEDAATGTELGKSLILLAHVLVVFTFVGLYLRQTNESSSGVARVGMVVGVVGTIFVAAIVYVELAEAGGIDAMPVFATAGTEAIYTVGPLLFVLGLLLVGGEIAWQPTIPRWIGASFVVGALVFVAASVTDATSLLTVVGAVITGPSFLWGGVYLITSTIRSPDSQL